MSNMFDVEMVPQRVTPETHIPDVTSSKAKQNTDSGYNNNVYLIKRPY